MTDDYTVVFILGPTAVGKSTVAMSVARECAGAIVSADSMQVYRGMDIGTAKPSAADRAEIVHYLIDVIEPEQHFSVAEYVHLARQAVADAQKQGKLPIVVGGSSLYVKALLSGYKFPPVRGDDKLRRRLYEQGEQQGSSALHQELAAVDRSAADRIHPHDMRRIVRALEFWHLTGRRLSEVEGQSGNMSDRQLVFGLTMDREELYGRIHARVDHMIEQGLIDEVNKLVGRGLSVDDAAMQAVGYKELIAYMDDDLDLEPAITTIKRNSRRLAKRQFTWLRREQNIHWIDVSCGSHQQAIELICAMIKDSG